MKLPRLTAPERHGLIVLSLVVVITLALLAVFAPGEPPMVEPELPSAPVVAADSTAQKAKKPAKKPAKAVAPAPRHHLDERID